MLPWETYGAVEALFNVLELFSYSNDKGKILIMDRNCSGEERSFTGTLTNLKLFYSIYSNKISQQKHSIYYTERIFPS